MAVISGSTDVGVVDDRREKKPPDDCVPQFDPNKMLQHKNVQVENEEDNEGNNYKSKLNTHFIAYFEQQEVGTFYAAYTVLTMHQRKESSRNETEVDEFEEDELGNFSIE
eukprot:3733412-Ditylum_brightwellii.AAC.1